MIRRSKRMMFALAVIAACEAVISNRARAQTTHVIHVTVDGLRGDILPSLMDTEPGEFPNLGRLRSEGAFTFNARSDFTHTQTIPTHGSILSGRPVTQPALQPSTVPHGYTRNGPAFDDTIHANGNPEVPYVSSTFDVVHDNGLSTSFFVSKERLRIYSRSWDAGHGAEDMIGEDNGRAKIDRSVIMDQDTDGLLTEFDSDMQTDPYNYSLVHITDPDTAGHANGFSSAEYGVAVAAADTYLGRIFGLIDSHPELMDHAAIVMVSDHGGGVPESSHTDASALPNYKIPMAVWGPGIPAAADLYDLYANRFDPGDARPDYDAPRQPLWNGDTGNIAVSLLGLGPIPGSTLIPVPVPEPSAATLFVVGVAFTALAARIRV